jgi:transcriptional regulator with XRE-family HTH domain
MFVTCPLCTPPGLSINQPTIERLGGAPYSTVQCIESGKSKDPRTSNLYQICKVLKISISFLLNDDEDLDFIYKNEYQKILKDENFHKYFEIAQIAFNKGVSPKTLKGLIQTLAGHQ